MAKTIQVQPGEVQISVYNADDGASIFKDGTEILKVNFLESKSTSFELGTGDTVDLRMQVYNLTGGNYSAQIVVNAAGRRIYNANPSGGTPPLWNIAWEDSFTLSAK